jgi:RimJ/RimL family protein N-acetyltransferase
MAPPHPKTPTLCTQRLLLRPWRDGDYEPFAALNADPAVMEHFPAPLSRAESNRFADQARRRLAEDGFGFWAVELPETAPFIGFVGIAAATFTADFTPCIEVGWRLAREFWGQGLAPEAAARAVDFGFSELHLKEIFSFTATANSRSMRVMEKIGMEPAGRFLHPGLPSGHRLEQHILYRLAAPQEAQTRKGPTLK